MNLIQPKDWIYFAKGNANVLFKYDGPNEKLKNQLLRLRLAKPQSQYVPTIELYTFMQEKCKQLFPNDMIDIELVHISQDVYNQLSHDDYPLMATEPHGILMENVAHGNYTKVRLSKYCAMFIGTGEDSPDHVKSVILEFKPKWLYDNTSNYCRTCLLLQLKNHPRHFCPLDLVAGGLDGVQDMLATIPAEIQAKIDSSEFPLELLLAQFVQTPRNLLQRLKENQQVEESDQISSLKCAEDVLERLLMAMTLRDVGVFLKFSRAAEPKNDAYVYNGQLYAISSFVYDLDQKSAGRFDHWKATENSLEHFYNSTNPEWRHCKKATDQHTRTSTIG